MSARDPHPEVAEELRQLAQAILDRLDPAIRAAAARAAAGLSGPGRCQQVWCPVCALAAMVTGEQHPLLTVIAEHSVSLLTVIRTMTAQAPAGEAGEPGAGSPDPTVGTAGSANGSAAGYHPIAFTVEPAGEEAPDPTVDPAAASAPSGLRSPED